ncbi:MAG: DEAD/DEAH box helicase [Campylobacterota bacterium]|nr:DEAD/DEAH box helicase [Campylobacterota bacterium]
MTQKSEKLYYDPLSVARRTKQKVYFVAQHDKKAMLEKLISNTLPKQMVIVTKSKRSANELSQFLMSRRIKALSIHGNHRIEDKKAATKSFNSAQTDVLITTDMILQSLELSTVSVMLSYDLPLESDHYLSRLGFLQELGESIAFVGADDERALSNIEYVMKADIPQEELEGFVPTPFDENSADHSQKNKRKKPRHRSQKSKKVGRTKEE